MKWTRDEGILVLDAKYLVCAQLRFRCLSELNPNQTQLYRLSEERWVSVSPAQGAGECLTKRRCNPVAKPVGRLRSRAVTYFVTATGDCDLT